MSAKGNPLPQVPPFTVPIGPGGQSKTFASVAELSDWIAAERDFWNPILNAHGPPLSDPHLNGVRSQVSVFAGKVSEVIQQLERGAANASLSTAPHDPSWFGPAMRELFDEWYVREEGILFSGDPRAQLVRRIAARGDEFNRQVAIATFANFIGEGSSSRAPWVLQGAIEAALFRLNLPDARPYEAESMALLRGEWEKKFEALRVQLSAAQSALEDRNREFDKTKEVQEREFRGVLEGGKADRERLEEHYDKHLALFKPVRYWQKKATSHKVLSWCFGVASLAAAGVAFWRLGVLVADTLRPPVGAAPDWRPEHWRVAVTISAGVFSVWLVRILVRLFMSNVHLLADARERCTMAQTYLALLRRNGGLTDDDRKLVLGALFRPSVTGVVKDDGIPLSALEMFSKIPRG